MLSYLHAFHAGSHADILKHTVLTALLGHLTGKIKPLRYIDTHAGAGAYSLGSAAAQKNREHAGGIARIWMAEDAPAPVSRLVELVRRCNHGAELEKYPGSPWLARECLRPTDSLYLFELHPAEQRLLKEHFEHDNRVKVLHEDGLAGCIGLLPPPERRALVLIDPSYELKDEHRQVAAALVKAQRRFATGVFAVWYPVIERRWVQRFEHAIRAASVAPLQLYELSVAPDGANRGLTGSGMLVLNPPWKLREELQIALPWLAQKLGIDGGGSYRVVVE